MNQNQYPLKPDFSRYIWIKTKKYDFDSKWRNTVQTPIPCLKKIKYRSNLHAHSMFNYREMVFNVSKENKCLVIRFLTDYKKFMMFEEAFQKNTNFSSSNFLEDSRETKVFFHTKGNSLETLNSFNELTMQKVPSKTKPKDSLIVSFYKLKLEFDKCSEVLTDLPDSLTNDSSQQMMREYQDLKLKHEKVLRSFVNSRQNTKLSSFILHFLFDLQSEEEQLTSMESHHFCEFLVNRYFKILRVKVFREIEKLS